MSDKLRRELEKRQALELENAAKRALEEEDFDLAKVSQRLAAYDYLLSKFPSRRNRKTLVAVAVGLACVTLAGLLWIARTGDNKIVLDLNVTDAGMTFKQQYNWQPDQSLLVKRLELSRLEEVVAPPALRMALRSSDGDGRLAIEKGQVLVSQLAFLPRNVAASGWDAAGARVEFHIEDNNVLQLVLKAASLRTRFSVQGDILMTSKPGRSANASVFESLIDPAGPAESIETISASDKAIPAIARVGIEEQLQLHDALVEDLSFYKHQSVASAQESFISSVVDGSLTFAEVGRTLTFAPRTRLTFDGSKGRVLQLVIDNNIQLSFEGRVDRLYLNDQDVTPRWLEYLYHSQPIALIWAAIGFLWGLFWSLKNLLV